MQTKKAKLVIFDEPEYAELISGFLQEKEEAPFEVFCFSDREELLLVENINLLLVSEKYYYEGGSLPKSDMIVILNESGVYLEGGHTNICKYRPADEIYRKLCCVYAESGQKYEMVNGEKRTRLIGMFSPVRRCLQTSFAIILGNLLAKKHRVLYIDMGIFSGVSDVIEEPEMDLGDLLYFLDSKQSIFSLRLQGIVKTRDHLDMIPPMRNGLNIGLTSGNVWKQLLRKITECGIYDYIVLDLSVQIQGLLDILAECERVITLTNSERHSLRKMTEYEKLLELVNMEEILDKSVRLNLPIIKNLPDDMFQCTRGELMDYVKEQALILEGE